MLLFLEKIVLPIALYLIKSYIDRGSPKPEVAEEITKIHDRLQAAKSTEEKQKSAKELYESQGK